MVVSDIAVFVLKKDVKLQPTNLCVSGIVYLGLVLFQKRPFSFKIAPSIIVSDIAIFVLKRDVKLQLTNCPFHWGFGPHLVHGSLAHPSSQAKWHLDGLSRFCRSHYCGRLTDRPHYSL